jgi:hypothetical protein
MLKIYKLMKDKVKFRENIKKSPSLLQASHSSIYPEVPPLAAKKGHHPSAPANTIIYWSKGIDDKSIEMIVTKKILAHNISRTLIFASMYLF